MNKQVSILTVIAMLALGLAVWLIQSPSKDTFEAGLLFDDLQEFANQVDSVEITNAQGVLFSARKLGESWLATIDPAQPVYPISQDKLAEFVETIMRAKLVEAKTSKPKNYIRLGLQSINIDDSMASVVTLKASGKAWQVLVGNKVMLGEGQYILKPGDIRSWRTDKTIHIPMDKVSWLKQPILPYEAQDISSVSRVDSTGWQISRSVGGDFQLIIMPKGKELKYPSILNSIVTSLTSLDFEELIAADHPFPQSLNVLTQLELITTDQNIFEVVVSELNDEYFVNFSATNQTEYWQKWYYRVSNFTAQQLIKTLEDFLAQEESIISNNDSLPQVIDEGDSPD
ncbi:MAG: hypothetical protein ACI9LE_001146 [Paraglaciecola sp.]|jgi:hypothetical protein